MKILSQTEQPPFLGGHQERPMQTTDMIDWPAPAWPAWRLQESQQTAAVEPQDSFHGAVAWLRILAAAGDLEGARQKLAALRTSLAGRILGSGELRQIIPISLLVHDQRSALHFLAAVAPTTIDIRFAVKASLDHAVVLMRVERRSMTFIFSKSLFSDDHGEILLQRLIDGNCSPRLNRRISCSGSIGAGWHVASAP